MRCHPMTLVLAAALLAGALLSPAAAQEDRKAAPEKVVDLAICLDTSGSMSGLINAARTRIWSIVNDLALARPTPRLRVALYAYGGGSYDPAAGYVALQTDFTEDLDLVSNRLFALSAGGSVELVGRVLFEARTKLSWTRSPDALKLILVAGNETADQDKEHPFRDMARQAIAEGIMVNSIFCGNPADAVAPEWAEIAKLSDGHYAVIDQDRGTVDIASPFDGRLAELSTSLNGTYVAFGSEGLEGKRQQVAQDSNAAGASGNTAAQRAVSKSSRLYRVRWCLANAVEEGEVDLETVKKEDLPEEMREMSLEEMKAYLDTKRAAREKIQKEIQEIGAKRQEWIAAELKRRGESDDKAFDAAVRKALRAQAETKGFQFEDE